MNKNEIKHIERLTGNVKALIVILLFRLLFGGYLIGKDQYYYNDIDSALIVLLTYGLTGIFAALFLLGKRYGLIGLIILSVIPIILQSIFVIVILAQTTVDPSVHNPLTNWWITLLNYLLSLLTLIFSIKVYRETLNPDFI